MKLALFLLVVSALSITIVFPQKTAMVQVRVSPETFQGDLLLTGNNVTIIEGQFNINGSIIVEGNATLILRNVIVNFALTHHMQFNISLQNPSFGNPRLLVENASVNSNNYYMTINLFGNSSAELNRLTLGSDLAIPYPYLLLYGESSATMRNSEVTYIPAMGNSDLVASESSIATIGGYDNASVGLTSCEVDSIAVGDQADLMSTNCTFSVDAQILATNLIYSIVGLAPGFFKYWSFTTNCTVQGATIPHLSLANTQVGNWSFISQGNSSATISKSETRTLRFLNSSLGQLSNITAGWIISQDNATADVRDSTTDWVFTYNNSRIQLANTTSSNYCLAYDESEIVFNWYLDVFISDSISQPVSFANVTATYSNAKPAGSKLTDGNGHARFILLEKTRNATGQYFASNYTIGASYETYSNSTTVAIHGNQELELVLAGLQIPEQPIILVLSIFILITLIAGRVCRRDRQDSQA